MHDRHSPDSMRLLPGDVLARFAQGKVRARNLVEGFKSGDHRSPFLGTSTEFAEHRAYSPGDDPRTLDWRVFGKMDRYCVKQYVEETNLRATIVMDCSASMGFAGEHADRSDDRPLSKLEYAKRLAALIAYLFIRQGDSCGLVTYDSAVRTFLPAGSRPSHLRRIVHSLHESTANNPSRTAGVIHEIAERIPRRGIVVLLGDFLDDVPELIHSLYHLAHHRHELILFHILAEEELSFPFRNDVRFRDLEELIETMNIAPDAIRADYRQHVRAHLTALEKGCQQVRAEYLRFCTRTSFEAELLRFLARRMGK